MAGGEDGRGKLLRPGEGRKEEWVGRRRYTVQTRSKYLCGRCWEQWRR